MTSTNIEKVLNRVTIDSITLLPIILLILISVGAYRESGDINAGSMYGLFILPLLPLVVVSLALIQISRSWLSSRRWIASFTPLAFIVGSKWLEPFNAYLLVGAILLVILFSLLKQERNKS